MSENMEVNFNEMDMKLTDLPPEICEHICQMLPSLSLFNMPTISKDFQNIATREMELRHQKLDKRKMMLMTETGDPQTIFNTIGMLCPGMVMLFNSLASGEKKNGDQESNNNQRSSCPVTGKHTLALHMQKSLFTTTSDRLSQCILTTHFSSKCPVKPRSNPKCFKIVSASPSDVSSSPVVMIMLPVNINHFRKIRNSNPWNIIHSNKSVSDMLGNVAVHKVILPKEHIKAQYTLVKEVLGEDLDVSLYFNDNLMQENPNMYEDMDTYVLVLSDPATDNSVHIMLESFFAKIFKPLKVSWIRIVSEEVKNSEIVSNPLENIILPPVLDQPAN